jgi:hypothetical protein
MYNFDPQLASEKIARGYVFFGVSLLLIMLASPIIFSGTTLRRVHERLRFGTKKEKPV